MKLFQYLSRQPRLLVLLASIALVFIVGFIDYASWPEVAFTIFYLTPVCVVALFVGRREGILMSFLATIAWLTVEFSQHPTFAHFFVPYWNGIVRLGIFLVSSLLISEIVARKEIETQLRGTQRELERQVQERTAELERNKLLEKQILSISEREQCRMGQDLHDGLCQHLVSASFAANVLHDRLAEKGLAEAADVDAISEMLNDGLTQARKLARSFYPVRLEVDGLASALEEFADHIQDVVKVRCELSCHGSILIPDLTVGANLYRIAQEAVFNAVKHADADRISITLTALEKQMTLTVSDNGAGFSPDPKNNGGMGLHIMHYRARMIGASLDIRPGDAGGTTVVCSLNEPIAPLKQNANAQS